MVNDACAESEFTGMGTNITHKAFGKNPKEALKAVADESERLEKMLSCFIHESEISRVNKSAGIKYEKLSSETFKLLTLAALFSNISDGLFDVTIGPLVSLWDYKNASTVPTEANIKCCLPLVNYRNLALNSHEETAMLKKVGQSIDLGGIAKGYASDRFIEVFKEYGIVSAFTNIGGNVSTLGNKPDGSPWRVGIRHPRQDDCLFGAVEVTEKSVVTSGDYERYFVDKEGKRYHHILNPSTGYPAESGLISVTVVADSAMLADALSTIIFIAGMEKGLKYLKLFPQAEVILVDNRMQLFITNGLQHCFRSAAGIKANII